MNKHPTSAADLVSRSWSASDFLDAVGRAENETLDFKRRFQASDERHLAAMAMTSGGLIVVGVDDDGTVVGCALDARLRDLIVGRARDITLDVSVDEVEVGDTRLTVIGVPEVRGRIITTSDGRVLRRVGSASRPLVGDELARFVRERTSHPAEEDVIPTFRVGDLSLDAVNDVLQAAGRGAVGVDGVVDALVDLRLAERHPSDPRGPVVHTAAIIAFGRDPAGHVPGARVQFVRRAGRDVVDAPVTRRETFSGPVVLLIANLVEAIADELPTFESLVGLRRARSSVIPLTVIREAVVNAIAHRDYGLRNATVDVTVTDDSLVIQSPGPLPGHVTVDNMRDEHYSRNPRLMNVLRVAGLVEEFGDGVDRMFEDMAERLLPEPVFVATSSSVSVTLRATSGLTLDQQAWLRTLSDVTTSRDERRVLLVARDEGHVTRRRLRELPLEAEPEHVLSSMVRQRLLESRGRRGGKHYVLSQEVRARSGDSSILAEQARRQLIEDELRRRGDSGLSTREAANLLDEEELRGARHLLNDLVDQGVAEARGRTAARRYHAARD
ncbi:MAG TPA: ATP-binding protein [Nitriliruptorales bacterium]